MPERLGVMFGIGSAAQLLTLHMLVTMTLSQRQLMLRPILYLLLPRYMSWVWRLYAGLVVAFVGFMAYVVFYDGRNLIIICAMVVATSIGFGYAAVGLYKEGRRGDAVIQIGFGLSFIGYSGMLTGPLGLRMIAATLMMVGTVGSVIAALFLPVQGEDQPLDTQRA